MGKESKSAWGKGLEKKLIKVTATVVAISARNFRLRIDRFSGFYA
jgi:hypothetical protein